MREDTRNLNLLNMFILYIYQTLQVVVVVFVADVSQGIFRSIN